MSLLLFIMVMDVLTENVRHGSLMAFLYANNLALCEELLNEFITSMEVGKMQWKERVQGQMLVQQNICSYLGRQVVFQKWILAVFVVSQLVVILFSIQNIRGVFIFVVLMCLGR